MKGKFITFEGGEGVGKTTQLRLIREYLEDKGVDAVFLREPGGNEISEKIREVILDRANFDMTGMCEALLYSAARAQLCEKVIRPALEKENSLYAIGLPIPLSRIREWREDWARTR